VIGARAIGVAATVLAAGMLVGSPARAAVSPAGALQAVDCTGIEGWTHDPDVPLEITDVHLYFGGPAGDPAATAIVVRADTMLAAGCDPSQCAHGFRSGLPMSLLDDLDHVVHAYGIDLSGDPNLELTGSPLTFSCPPPPIVGGEKRHVVSPEILTAWQLSTFFDLLVVDDALLGALPEAGPLDAAPSLAVADGPDPTVWLLDGGFRRFVDPAHATAWRLDLAMAVVMPAAELVALPEGTPLRPRPILLQGTMPAVYLLDDHQCVVGDPDPSCREPGGDTDDPDDPTGPGDGADTSGGDASGDTESAGDGTDGSEGSGSGGPGSDTGATSGLGPLAEDDGSDAGCGCRSTSAPSLASWLSGMLLLGAWSRRPRRP
jgi:MYXO-CTERM domain-containing protein